MQSHPIPPSCRWRGDNDESVDLKLFNLSAARISREVLPLIKLMASSETRQSVWSDGVPLRQSIAHRRSAFDNESRDRDQNGVFEKASPIYYRPVGTVQIMDISVLGLWQQIRSRFFH